MRKGWSRAKALRRKEEKIEERGRTMDDGEGTEGRGDRKENRGKRSDDGEQNQPKSKKINI